jgi:ferredoxin-NADP reductase/ferredoxin/truncated hemoglobin YjbI
MPRLVYQDVAYESHKGESVLETLQRHGVTTPFSCRSGICHACLRRCVSGAVPEKAQTGLQPTLRAQGYFMPCVCVPSGDMVIEPPRDADLFSRALVYAKELLAPDVLRLLLEPATALSYRAGQFINLRRPDGLTRSYSLASVPAQDYFLELHIKRMPNGALSNWLFDVLKVNDEIDIQGPHGDCCYSPGDKDQNLLLLATGTGLAPIYGIVREALHTGHSGQIYLYHASHRPEGVYLRDALVDLSTTYTNLHYLSCVSGKQVPHGFLAGRVHNIAFAVHPDLHGWQVYAAGLPKMVRTAETLALRAGARANEIHADPFEYRDLRRHSRQGPTPPAAPDRNTDPAVAHGRSDRPSDPEMWAALKDGDLLTAILADFYTRVYDDPRLAPFFHGVTRQRSIEKQFLFLRQIFTGEKVYFGDRPRNAHHWMVISDELFDYREELMMSCLRRHGLPEHLVQRWRAMEEPFRAEIVKSEPWNRVMNGMELPVDGFGETILEFGTLCDSCGCEIAVGEKVRYHLRLGSTWCSTCTARGDLPTPPAT